MNYEQTVEQNLKFMGTPRSEWRAVPIVGVDKTKVNGKMVEMPVFEFPTGYNRAESMFKNDNSANLCCELCGHPIMFAYWLQNDTRHLLLLVGSECVTHFEDASGQELTKEAKHQQNLAKINEVQTFMNDLIAHRGVMNWQGKMVLRQFSWNEIHLYRIIRESLAKLNKYRETGIPKAVATRWVNDNYQACMEASIKLKTW